jgi:two-component sensor histidine kinase
MSALIRGIGSRKHLTDFSLVPVAIIFIEFSVFVTQLSSVSRDALGDLVILRFLHTVLMIFVSVSVSRIYIWRKRPALSYRNLAITGVFVMAFGDLTHFYLASGFGIELIPLYRRLGIIGLQGILWFPAFMIIAGNRREIFRRFKDYEQRLISATRLGRRTSSEFKELQMSTQSRIREQLHATCIDLKNSITKVSLSDRGLAEKNTAIQHILSGEDLRKLSMTLDTFQPIHQGRTFMGQNLSSIKLLAQQFRILYATSVRLAPLSKSSYLLVLFSLVTPAYVYFYSFAESIFSLPILLVFVLILSNLITKSQSRKSPNSLITSSALIYLTGLLPLAVNLLGQAIYHDPQTQFPILITGLVLPLTYYLSMELLQILRPSALNLIREDKLESSLVLQRKVTEQVNSEFLNNLSHRWAIFIHGKILTRLAATALKLETAAGSGNTREFGNAVDSLLSLLSTPDAEFEEESTDLETEINSRLKPWIGLLDISLYVDPNLKSIRNPRVRDLGEVIEELISNSIRHGKAKKIELKVLWTGHKDIEITALDDAVVQPPEFAIRSGLGTRIFNLASDGRWSITRNGSSTEFRLIMGIEA